MASIKLKEREIPLLYTMMEMKQIQEEVARIGEFLNVLFGKSAKDGEDSADLYGGPEQLGQPSQPLAQDSGGATGLPATTHPPHSFIFNTAARGNLAKHQSVPLSLKSPITPSP